MKYFLMLFCIILLIGCEKAIDHNLLNKRVLFDRETALTKADLIMNNKIYVWDLWEPIDYKDRIQWNINPYNSDSWVLYFHSLRMVGILARAYEYNQEDKYIEKAMVILRSWVEYNKTNLDNIYQDHMVANRVLNISHLYFVAPNILKTDDKKLIESIILEHGEWLYNDQNYTKGNHAIMQDRALMQASLTFSTFKDDEWYNKSLERVTKTFDAEITSEGVCVENSPGYHPYVMDLLQNFIVMGENFNRPFPEKYKMEYEKMVGFLTYIIKPNNKFPTFGDTYFTNSTLHFSNLYKSQELLFVDTKGLKGIKPAFTDKVYQESGYAIFREGWKKGEEFSKQTQLSFINTNQSFVHKHSDYLSFELYSNNEDLIVDAGHIGYNKDSITAYLKSTIAHNTITIDNRNINYYKVPLYEGARITNFNSNDTSAHLKAFVKPDTNTTFKRDIIYVKPNAFILIDRYELTKIQDEKMFQQAFNLGGKLLDIEKNGSDRLIAKYPNNNLHFIQKTKTEKVNIFKAEKNLRGTVADGPLKFRKGTQIVFEKDIRRKNEPFITLLLIENDKNGNIPAEDIDIYFDNPLLIVSWNNGSQKLVININD
ncbi:heparinase II/III-like protein [Ulvibacter sp. MAR_2010_11]|uniref:heparinase II/III family protein n=1 Tax=Ulvibacter sp. MAR_2010_11 TaxID=1250229 RepID=UPI000C2BF26F|nr:heparinase II/III family protein [Ulvibacter sp. MAR_2010_11]PKA82913.1 heparinase II/III-like protein [Ulvibacter sp. MAR_2010_11]